MKADRDQPENKADEAFRRELLGTLPHLRAFARGLSGRPDYADDLAQEAAIKAWTARERDSFAGLRPADADWPARQALADVAPLA